jgi:hypothetical protein
MEETQRAPVFMRSFRLSREKSSTYTVSKNYHSFYGLYSSYLFLYYFKYVIKNAPLEYPVKDKLNLESHPEIS